ncbi:MAG: FkbM family methyltransferase [Sphingobacteriales bacterium]|nr:FkbM family methyltransferase [Sphingobacteriales bacterium]
MKNRGFWYRRLAPIFSCVLKTDGQQFIALKSKHHIAAFQDVYVNPFYWEALLQLKFIPQTIFDLGANVGFFSSLCAQIIYYREQDALCDFFLIEANPQLVKELQKNSTDLIHGKTQVIYGLAGPKETSLFKTNKANLLASQITEKGGQQTPYVNFNELPHPDLLKIDIEGAEQLLFANYLEWVLSAGAIIIEFHFDGKILEEAMQVLTQGGFELIINRFESSGYSNQLWIKKES